MAVRHEIPQDFVKFLLFRFCDKKFVFNALASLEFYLLIKEGLELGYSMLPQPCIYYVGEYVFKKYFKECLDGYKKTSA